MPFDHHRAVEDLTRSLKRIHVDDEGYYLQGAVVQLCWPELRPDAMDKQKSAIARAARFASHDLGNMVAIVDRLNWLQVQLDTSTDSGRDKWMRYGSLDIDMFQVECRSLMDYLNDAACAAAKAPGQIRARSMRRLLEKLRSASKGESIKKRLGADLSDAVLKCEDWFWMIRAVRDGLVHEGTETMVFGDPTRILFQVHRGWDNCITEANLPIAMFNENVVDFAIYSGFVFGRLIAFADELASVIIKSVPLQPPGAKWLMPGLDIVEDWMQRARSACEAHTGIVER